jgi:hypothetical protein
MLSQCLLGTNLFSKPSHFPLDIFDNSFSQIITGDSYSSSLVFPPSADPLTKIYQMFASVKIFALAQRNIHDLPTQ